MYKLMQKYNRKLLAVVMVFLMIAFVIPQFSKTATPSTVAAGTVGDETIMVGDIQRSHAYWAIVKADANSGMPGAFIPTNDPRTGRSGYAPLVAALGNNAYTAEDRDKAIEEIDHHSAMYVLLQREATKNGVTVSQSEVDGVLADVFVRTPGSTTPTEFDLLPKDSEMADEVREAVREFLLVNKSFSQTLSMVKISQPLLQSRMAKEIQEIKLNLVEFDAKDYTDKVPPPTPDQISAQFNKHADILPSQADTKTNPFAFGYKYPNRVKVAFIGVSSAEVKKTIRAGKSDYDWDVLAQKHYKTHLSDFPTTQPATTKPIDAFSLGSPKPTTEPTTRPFAEVHDKIVDDLIEPEATKLENQIQSKITSQMREDWNAYHSAMTKSPPTTAPSTSLGVAYDNTDYLSKLGAQIQEQFKVVPVVQTMADKFRSVEELRDAPGIGKSYAEFGPTQFLPFNVYAGTLVDEFDKNPPADSPAPIRKFEPSRPMSDLGGDTTYIFRVIDTDPAHAPKDSRDVLQQVETDIRAQASYDLAKADADKLLGAAQSTSLAAAAADAHKREISPDYIQAAEDLPKDISVTPQSHATFIDQTFDMLSDAVSGKTPIKVVGLPRDAKLFVTQLSDVRRIPLFAGQSLEPGVARQIVGEMGRNMYQQWYNYDSLVQRTHFVDASKKKDSET